VFSPDDHALAADREMIRVAGGNLTIEGVHLWMRLPWEPADGWALFQLDQTRMVELRSCTLTIENADAFGSSLQDRVAFFEVQSPSPQMDVGGVPARTSPPAISMVQTIARGRATLVHAAQVCPFRLTWSQGLFVSSEWMIEAGGATTSLQESMVEVDLQHVTAQLGQGLCRMEGRPSAPYLLYLDVDCSDCIFVTGTAAPLIEHVGLPGDGDMKEPFKLRGEGNFYPEMNIVWRAVPSDSSFAAMEYGRESRDDKWSPEQFLRSRMILWNPRSGGEDRSLHQRDKGDYLLLDHPSNPALHSAEGHGKAGFDAALMPDAPESAEPPATNRDRAAPKGADGATSATRGNAAPTTAGDAAPKTADRAITDRVDRAALKGADRAASVIEDSATPARPADTPRSAASSAVEVRMEVRMEVAPDPARDTDSAPVSPRP
jgi:hypothetical protein